MSSYHIACHVSVLLRKLVKLVTSAVTLHLATHARAIMAHLVSVTSTNVIVGLRRRMWRRLTAGGDCLYTVLIVGNRCSCWCIGVAGISMIC